MMFQLSLSYGRALFKDLSLATLFADGGEVLPMENKVYDSEEFNWGVSILRLQRGEVETLCVVDDDSLARKLAYRASDMFVAASHWSSAGDIAWSLPGD